MPKNKKSQKNNQFNREILVKGLKIVSKQLKPHKRLVFILAILSIIASIIEAFVPFVSGKIIDGIILIYNDPTSTIVTVILFIIALLLLRAGHETINWNVGFRNNKLAVGLWANYLSKSFGRLFELPISFHKDTNHGEAGNKISRAANSLEGLINRVAIRVIPNFLTLIVAFIIVFTMNWLLSLVLVFAVIFYAVILWNKVPRLAILQKDMHKEYSEAHGEAYNALGNVEEVKNTGTENYEQDQIYANFTKKANPIYVDFIKLISKIDVYQRFLVIFAQISIFGLSIYFVQQGTLTPGQLVAFNGYAAMVFSPFVIIGRDWQTIQNGFIDLVETDKILNMETENYFPKGGVSPMKFEGKVEFKNVSFKYEDSDKEVLKNISFLAKPGERIALVGKSGVGKSTLISLLFGLNKPTKGEILIDGRPIEGYNLQGYRSRFGIVSQEPTLFNNTVLHNIKYGSFDASMEEVKEAAKKAYADEFIDEFDKKYKQIVGWKGVKLSIGQKQRVALARAFLKNPDILVLDEPTSALDAKSEQTIKDSLEKLMKGRTTIIIAHRLSTIREADKILVLKGGKVVEEGKHEELVKKKTGAYRKLYDLQVGMYKD
ncbi:MAG: ABC transporter ATP-binding protein [Candidatus Paceibacterota bacterium]